MLNGAVRASRAQTLAYLLGVSVTKKPNKLQCLSHPSPIFASKAGANLSEPDFRWSTLG